MCCFSEEVEKVSATNIFARGAGARQLIVYSMAYAAKSELAMVLPIPVTPGAAEDAVRFINLEDCPNFFEHLRRGTIRPAGSPRRECSSLVPPKAVPLVAVNSSFEHRARSTARTAARAVTFRME